MDLEKIREAIYAQIGERSSHPGKDKGNKYYHGQRVANLALELRRRLFPDDSEGDAILTVAAWFHDICNGTEKVEEHARLGAQKTRVLLQGLCAPEEIDRITAIITVHDERRAQENTYSNLIKLHQDADHLDHFGTFEVWNVSQFTAVHGQTMQDAATWLQKSIQIDYPRYRAQLNFEVSQKIFDEKTEFLKSFTERFAVEAIGGVWNPLY